MRYTDLVVYQVVFEHIQTLDSDHLLYRHNVLQKYASALHAHILTTGGWVACSITQGLPILQLLPKCKHKPSVLQFASHLVRAVGVAFEPCPVLGLWALAIVDLSAVLQRW